MFILREKSNCIPLIVSRSNEVSSKYASNMLLYNLAVATIGKAGFLNPCTLVVIAMVMIYVQHTSCHLQVVR